MTWYELVSTTDTLARPWVHFVLTSSINIDSINTNVIFFFIVSPLLNAATAILHDTQVVLACVRLPNGGWQFCGGLISISYRVRKYGTLALNLIAGLRL